MQSESFMIMQAFGESAGISVKYPFCSVSGVFRLTNSCLIFPPIYGKKSLHLFQLFAALLGVVFAQMNARKQIVVLGPSSMVEYSKASVRGLPQGKYYFLNLFLLLLNSLVFTPFLHLSFDKHVPQDSLTAISTHSQKIASPLLLIPSCVISVQPADWQYLSLERVLFPRVWPALQAV